MKNNILSEKYIFRLMFISQTTIILIVYFCGKVSTVRTTSSQTDTAVLRIQIPLDN